MDRPTDRSIDRLALSSLLLPCLSCALAPLAKATLDQMVPLMPGDYALVHVGETSGHTLRGTAIARTTLMEHACFGGHADVSGGMVMALAGWSDTAATRAVQCGDGEPTRVA